MPPESCGGPWAFLELLIGGLLTSTLLTLEFVPAMYTLFDDLQNLVVRVFRDRLPIPNPTRSRVPRRVDRLVPVPALVLATSRQLVAADVDHE